MSNTAQLTPPEGMTLFADEAQFAKNRKAKRTQRLAALAAATRKNGGRTFGLTGTPLRNVPPELWQVLETFGVAEEAFGHFGRFYYLMGGRKTEYGTEWDTPKAESAEVLRKVMLRRERQDVLKDLPGKRWQPILVEQNGECRRIEGQILDLFAAKGCRLLDSDEGDEEISRGLGIAFEEIARYRHALEMSKLPAAEEICASYEDAGTPLVVFGAHIEPVMAIGTREGWAAITGETPMADRMQAVNDFQAGKLKGLAVTIACAGFGLTLTRAATGLFLSMPWTPADLDQAEDRLCRIGQKAEGLLYIQLICNDRLEKRVHELLSKKRAIIRASVSAASHREGTAPTASATAAQAAAALEQATTAAAQPAPAPVAPQAPAAPKPEQAPRFRGPANKTEEWAARAIQILAGSDPDRAREQNGVGFNKLDGAFGHSLADSLAQYGRLSEKQWAAAVRLAQRYPRQVGRPEGA